MRRLLIISLLSGLMLFALALWLQEPAQLDALSSSALISTSQIDGFARADHPRSFSFPTDYGPHPDFQTEWWYYTGNLISAEGQHFGYQLTFFRRGLLPQDQIVARDSAWGSSQIYMAHFALTNTQTEQHWAFERFSREGANLAGAEGDPLRVWLENWSLEAIGPETYHLIAAAGDLSLDLELQNQKEPILHGQNGLSQKGAEVGNASYYFSQTQLLSEGQIEIGDQSFRVSGYSWMDHEFSTSALGAGQVGWDWFSIQLENGSELMLFQLRREDGQMDPFSSATFVEVDGSTSHFGSADFLLEPLAEWNSSHSGASYPIQWRIDIPEIELSLEIQALVEDQELNLSFIYWEGAVRISGLQNGKTISGMGYIEMTGYAQSMEGQF